MSLKTDSSLDTFLSYCGSFYNFEHRLIIIFEFILPIIFSLYIKQTNCYTFHNFTFYNN